MKPSAKEKQLRRKVEKLEGRLKLAEELIKLLRRCVMGGGDPAAEKGTASERAATDTAAGKSTGEKEVAGDDPPDDRGMGGLARPPRPG